jgi:hypothetical protein
MGKDDNRLTTLSRDEGIDGLLKLSDPQMLAGRVACISLFMTSSSLLSLVASTAGSPLGDSAITFGWDRKLYGLYRYSVPATPRYSSLRLRLHGYGPPQAVAT